MRKLTVFLISLLVIAAASQLSSCKKAKFYSSENLEFSADTVVFDTIFTTVGSTTKRLKIYNPSNRTLKVDEIELMGGEASPFRINVDGLSGTAFNGIEIEGNDSLWIFVEVTLDPNGGTLPLVIEDSIRFQTNGTDQYVVLAAWGQDAYFHYNDTNTGTWPNDKPHVIYGYAGIDEGQSLTIQAGTDIYLHNNSWLLVYKGSVHIEGTKSEPVTFQGDRLESAYDDVASQYGGIYFLEAQQSSVDYAIIKNGTAGLYVIGEDPGVDPGYTVEVSNTIIQNCGAYGMYIYDGGSIKAENCIVSKSGIHAFLLLQSGDFNFNHCHLLSYGSGQSVSAAIGITNYYDGVVGHINEGTITNSVIYGYGDHEIAMDTSSLGTMNFLFDHNVIKSETQFTDAFYNNTKWNTDPLFTDIEAYDYTWPSWSPLNNWGSGIYPVTNSSTTNSDITGDAVRDSVSPDAGAYEDPQ